VKVRVKAVQCCMGRQLATAAGQCSACRSPSATEEQQLVFRATSTTQQCSCLLSQPMQSKRKLGIGVHLCHGLFQHTTAAHCMSSSPA
jgi:hypothetical protein